MLDDGVISLRDTTPEELPAIVRMEADDDAADFVTPQSVEEHERNLRDPELVYKSIYDEQGTLIGFIYLALDPDAASVELRRIVVDPKGKGYGRRAMALAEQHGARLSIDSRPGVGTTATVIFPAHRVRLAC